MNRLTHVSAALIQGLVIVPLTTASGAIISILVGNVWPGIEGGAVTGTWISFLASLLFVPSAMAAPVGPGRFMRWFFFSICLEQCCIGITAALSTYSARALPDVPLIAAYTAFVAYSASHIIFAIVFDDPVDLRGHPAGSSEGLSTFENIKRRANFFGRIRRGPGPDQGGSNWFYGWRVLSSQFKRARGGFYESPW